MDVGGLAALRLGQAEGAVAHQECLAVGAVIADPLASVQIGVGTVELEDVVVPAVSFFDNVAVDAGELEGLGVGVGLSVGGDADVGARLEGLLPPGGVGVAGSPCPLK